MKELIKLTANNNKGFSFIKKHGIYHQANVKNKGLVVNSNNKKVIIKHNNDKRFIVEKFNPRNIYS